MTKVTDGKATANGDNAEKDWRQNSHRQNHRRRRPPDPPTSQRPLRSVRSINTVCYS